MFTWCTGAYKTDQHPNVAIIKIKLLTLTLIQLSDGLQLSFHCFHLTKIAPSIQKHVYSLFTCFVAKSISEDTGSVCPTRILTHALWLASNIPPSASWLARLAVIMRSKTYQPITAQEAWLLTKRLGKEVMQDSSSSKASITDTVPAL